MIKDLRLPTDAFGWPAVTLDGLEEASLDLVDELSVTTPTHIDQPFNLCILGTVRSPLFDQTLLTIHAP